MAKITVSRELAAEFPSLADKVGKTIDASELQRARSDKRVNAKDAAKAPKAPAPAAAPRAPRAARPSRKAAAKKTK